MSNTPSIGRLFLSFLKLGLTAFGGPAMIHYIKEMSVHRYGWLDEKTFKDGVALCQSIPGATAMQSAAYVGMKARGTAGAIASFVGFGLPAFILMLILSYLYARYYTLPSILSLFKGLQVIVVAIVANAAYSFGKTTFKDYKDFILAIAAAALLGAGISPFLVIVCAAVTGLLILKTTDIALASTHEKTGAHSLKKIPLLLSVPLLGLLALYAADIKLFRLAALMMKIDLFAFGGGFASLPLMLHETVNVKGWLDNKTFMDGIALGQVTPGPIVITSTFVGFLTYGIKGAIVATLAIFTPSLLMVLAITPFFDKLKASKHFSSATRGILASFVGLLFFVGVKFASAVQWDVIKALVGFAALVSLLRKVDILYVVLIGAAISLFIF